MMFANEINDCFPFDNDDNNIPLFGFQAHGSQFCRLLCTEAIFCIIPPTAKKCVKLFSLQFSRSLGSCTEAVTYLVFIDNNQLTQTIECVLKTVVLVGIVEIQF